MECENGNTVEKYRCEYCNYCSLYKWAVKRHIRNKHSKTVSKSKIVSKSDIPENRVDNRSNILPTQNKINGEVYDVRLKENFNLFISGPSRCGKTFFISDLLENIDSFAKQPPSTIVYVYKVWQAKFDEMKSIVNIFVKDNENVVNEIKRLAAGQSIFVIFDDLINSSSLADISDLFTVDGRHMNMSMAFLTQRMFVNNENFRQISQNCDYFVIFKNPRNSSEIRTLAQQITPGSLDLVDIYMDATQKPFSYLFINLTQECQPKAKYLSGLFDMDHQINVYVRN